VERRTFFATRFVAMFLSSWNIFYLFKVKKEKRESFKNNR